MKTMRIKIEHSGLPFQPRYPDSTGSTNANTPIFTINAGLDWGGTQLAPCLRKF
jgi:hypothetical protein